MFSSALTILIWIIDVAKFYFVVAAIIWLWYWQNEHKYPLMFKHFMAVANVPAQSFRFVFEASMEARIWNYFSINNNS